MAWPRKNSIMVEMAPGFLSDPAGVERCGEHGPGGWGWPKAVAGPAEQETESASTQALCHWLRQLGI